jgi:hypothetical protein
LLVYHDVNIQFLRHVLHHFFLPVRVQRDIDARVLVQLNQLLDEGQGLSQHHLSLREFKLLLEEGVVEVQQVDMLRAIRKFAVLLFGRVEELILLEYFPLEPDVACVEYAAHVALQ